jgi:hypothetical protein
MCKSVKDSSKPRGIKQHKYNVEVEERRLRYILIVDLDTKESECGEGSSKHSKHLKRVVFAF